VCDKTVTVKYETVAEKQNVAIKTKIPGIMPLRKTLPNALWKKEKVEYKP
jgi:hypothetical protein